MTGGKDRKKTGSSRNIINYKGYSVLEREDNMGVLGIVPSWREVWTLVDSAICHVPIRIY